MRKNPAHDIVCFHAQQCVEKYLTARLCEAGFEAGRLHDLVALLERVLAFEPLWQAFRADLTYLFDVAFVSLSGRYSASPGARTP